MSLAEIREAVFSGEVSGGQAENMVTGVAKDNRDIVPGDLFVCIPGERMDGHDFATAAVQAGAAAVLAQRELPEVPSSVAVLRVDDTVKALGRLAAAWRMRTRAKVVGITGTAGKTTVKEVLAQVLSVQGPTARTAKNHNNQIGLPLSILNAAEDAAFWVMEAGISHSHDMEELAPVLRPDIGVVLNVGAGHTAGLGGRGVAWHKAQLLAHLAPGGTGLVSGDYPELVREARAACRNLLFFSAAGRPMPYRGAYKGPGRDGRGAYRLSLNGVALDVETPFRGSYGTENALAIAAIAHLLGLSDAAIVEGFAGAVLPEQRFQIHHVGGWQCVDDTYNANPLSMARMLDAAAELAAGTSLICVLGEMRELGEVAETEHERLGRHLGRLRPAVVFWRGGNLAALRAGLDAEGYTGPVLPVEDARHFRGELRSLMPKTGSGVMLFKGSRSNHLEELFSAITDCEEGDDVF